MPINDTPTPMQKLINASLNRIGIDALAPAEVENSLEYQLAAANLERLLISTLAAYQWSFATKSRKLEPDPKPDLSASFYKYSYSLPADYLGVVQVFQNSNQNLIDFRISSGKLFASDRPVFIEYIAQIEFEDVPIFLHPYLELMLASELAITLGEQLPKSDYYRNLAQEAYQKAVHYENQLLTSGFNLDLNSIIDSRF